eukprot:scaffold519_cov331-Pavlova_lutheri.AAC.5
MGWIRNHPTHAWCEDDANTKTSSRQGRAGTPMPRKRLSWSRHVHEFRIEPVLRVAHLCHAWMPTVELAMLGRDTDWSFA